MMMETTMKPIFTADMVSNGCDIFTQKRKRVGAPEFIKRLNAFEEAKAGSTVIFQCQYKAFPKPEVKWFKDDEEVTDNNRYVVQDLPSGDLSLTIKEVCKNDEGAFKCKVENQDGVASTTGYLSVTGSIGEKPLSSQPRKNPENCVSAPPHLRTIVEQKSVEERETEAVNKFSPSHFDEFIESFRKAKQYAVAESLVKAFSTEDLSSEIDDDDDDAQSTGSGSDTSVDSQDFDRIMEVSEVTNHNPVNTTPPVDINHSKVPGEEEPGYAHVTSGVSLQDVGLSPSMQVKLEQEPVQKTVVQKDVSYDISWLYYFALISVMTLIGNMFGQSPIVYTLMMIIIAMVSFQILVTPRERKNN